MGGGEGGEGGFSHENRKYPLGLEMSTGEGKWLCLRCQQGSQSEHSEISENRGKGIPRSSPLPPSRGKMKLDFRWCTLARYLLLLVFFFLFNKFSLILNCNIQIYKVYKCVIRVGLAKKQQQKSNVHIISERERDRLQSPHCKQVQGLLVVTRHTPTLLQTLNQHHQG